MTTARAPLTEVQQKVYDCIVSFMRKNRYPPTIREIQEHFGYSSSNSVVVHLRKLKEKGYITSDSTKTGMKSRTMKLVDDIIGVHSINMNELSAALKKIKERGYKIQANEAVEFLKELRIEII